MDKEIKGYTADAIADSSKQMLETEQENIKNKYADIRHYKGLIDEIQNDIERCQWEYRRKSVNRVLDYIRNKPVTDPRSLDILLCHCQNKLNGNIDGTELDLKNHGNEVKTDATQI